MSDFQPTPTGHPDLDALLAGVVAGRADGLPWLVLADWLDDHGRPDQAEFTRLHRRLIAEPAAHPARAAWQDRLSDLLAKGVEPCVPRATLGLGGGVRMAFVWVPGGTATLGSPASEADREDDEAEHEFTTAGFWLGKYPVTQAEWRAVTGESPSRFQGDRRPVEQVSWNDIRDKFLAKVCGRGGRRFGLPHEDEWEYAYRGGMGNRQPFYWGAVLDGSQANVNGNYPYGTDTEGTDLGETSDVGSYERAAPHPWGLCDMSGNVFKLCNNKYDNYSGCRVLRGGSWYRFACNSRGGYRSSDWPDDRHPGEGFRLRSPQD